MVDIEFHSQEWWINRVLFWEDMISDNESTVNRIEKIAQKDWDDVQRSDIRLAREAVKHAYYNLSIAKSKIIESA